MLDCSADIAARHNRLRVATSTLFLPIYPRQLTTGNYRKLHSSQYHCSLQIVIGSIETWMCQDWALLYWPMERKRISFMKRKMKGFEGAPLLRRLKNKRVLVDNIQVEHCWTCSWPQYIGSIFHNISKDSKNHRLDRRNGNNYISKPGIWMTKRIMNRKFRVVARVFISNPGNRGVDSSMNHILIM